MTLSRVPPLLVLAGLRYQLRHRWQLLLAMTGIVMGVAVVLAVDLANGAAKASFEQSSKALQGTATHRIVGIAGKIDETLYSELFTTAEQPLIAPVIVFNARLVEQDARVQVIGLDLFAEQAFRPQLPALFQSTASLGDWLSRPDTAVISASAAQRWGLDVGDRVQIAYRGEHHRLTIMAVSDDQRVGTQHLVVVDIATAQALSGLAGKLSHIDLVLDETAARQLVQKLPSDVRLVDVSAQMRDTAGLSASFELNLFAMSLLALLVGMFLIFNAISFSVVQRYRLFGRLRAIGVRDKELASLVMAEAAILAILGTFLGTLIGYWLGQGLTQIVASAVSELYYDVSTDAMKLGWSSLGKAWFLGIVGTLMAAWLPARRASTLPALTTLSRATLEQQTRERLPPLTAIGFVLLAAGLVTAIYLPGGVFVGFVGLFMVLLGAALITPMALRLARHGLQRLPFDGVWQIAVRDLDRHLSRLSTATAALMIALAASVGVATMVDSMRSAVDDWLKDLLTADVYLSADGFEDNEPLPPHIVTLAEQIPAVSALSSYRGQRLQTDLGQIELIAARLAPASRMGFEFIQVNDEAPWRGYDQGQILISEPLSQRLSLEPGETLSLPTPDGSQEFIVAAVFRDFASEHGRVFIDAEIYRLAWGDAKIDSLALFSESLEPASLYDIVNEAFAGYDGLVFTLAREIHTESMRIFENTFRITEALRLISLAVAFFGVLSALMALQLERRKEYAILRALGLTPAQISRLIVIESLGLGLVAALLAIPTGVGMAWILTEAIQLRAFGWSMPLRVEIGALIQTIGVGIAAALLASLYPAWRSAHEDPAPQLRED